MLRKKEVYTVITPIPGFIPRQLAVDILQSHSEVITLNPLVIEHKPIPAPRDAAADEFYSTWYEITERVTFVPGIGKMGSSKITFKGVFHDVPGGLQTHIYVPFGIDLRNRYHIGGNQPGVEAPEHRELGLDKLGAPKDGLYLREDIEIRGNISVVGFVKSQLKAASKEMVQRIIRKAELLDAGVLQAMMTEDGKLHTVNPNDRSHHNATPGSPTSVNHPAPYHQQRPPSASPAMSYARPDSTPSPRYPTSPGPYHQQFGHQQHQQQHQQQQYGQQQQSMTPPPLMPHKEQPTLNEAVMELPGDFQYSGQQSFVAELPSEPVLAPADNKK
ncbi:hypothetical protein ACRE_017990 [Hapsidospora chrysogenum ATCC 11550]|uniref:DUF7053 domain-containing protein n=1 Tax=Hapsidospora chrysogenum (strain ATCC 11550 / CBS 779.69 / DSM 880 / IAM 14645 / JCM 23072 / IMI 49137) TaxID=857340 RepID=A0A086TDE4_HAPC1|nr:hypothetical protein ACRE_017990 [Hapsidospora chrysogenum ATCC 11550]